MRNFSGRRVTNRQVIWTSSPADAIAAGRKAARGAGNEAGALSSGARASGGPKTTRADLGGGETSAAAKKGVRVRQTAVSRSQTDCSYGRLLVVLLELLYRTFTNGCRVERNILALVERWRTSSWRGVPTEGARFVPARPLLSRAAPPLSRGVVARDAPRRARPVVHELGVRPVLRAAVGPGDGRARHHACAFGRRRVPPRPASVRGATRARRGRARVARAAGFAGPHPRGCGQGGGRGAPGGRVHRRGGQDRRTTRAFGNLRNREARREWGFPRAPRVRAGVGRAAGNVQPDGSRDARPSVRARGRRARRTRRTIERV